ncbi:AAA family ATPase [Pseudomonas taiwanensis]|uniref:AAA family ATPase n=1 Tax=Pseudomonas taiwanensis TaxID=470150 RepID=A0ABR6V3R8_9PSED|nr:AAA family ATPase [Pseudomonas taiwanensis]MBC3474989.1 AAA family ATPase [Pseudomonas taiwanensis]
MGRSVAGQLRKARLDRKLNVHQAAMWASVTWRAWRAWESDSPSKRKPSPAALRLFFLRAGIPIPDDLREYLDPQRKSHVISITSSKGGVGKSPITVNVAACMALKGMRVAIITDDAVYRSMVSAGERPEANSLVSAVDIYDLRDVVIHPSEAKNLAKQIDRDLQTYPDKEVAHLYMREDIDTLKRKQQSVHTLGNLKQKYDYLLLDVKYDLKLLKDNCDIIGVIVDSYCMLSVRAAGRFLQRLKDEPSRKKSPKIFSLLTRYDIGGQSRELVEFLGNRKDISQKVVDKLRNERYQRYQYRETIFRKIMELPIPPLSVRLTSAHEVVIDGYNEEKSIWEGYCYFHSLPDIAPHSPAAAECMSLTEELIDMRL